MWKAVDAGDSLHATFANLPNGTTRLALSAYATPARAYTFPIATVNLPPTGDSGSVFFPTELGATAELYETTTIGGTAFQQFYVERFAAGTVEIQRDMTTRRLPWIAEAEFDIPTMTIQFDTAPNLGALRPSVSYAKLEFQNSDDRQVWHIIGTGAPIINNGSTGTFMLPPIPGDNTFEPSASNTLFSAEVYTFGVPGGLENAVRERIESREQYLDIFGIPGLDYVMKAVAF
jgi:hypothetical protein